MKETTFGERLLNLREKRNLTQKQVAKYLQVTSQAYSQYERDQRRPDFEILVKITEFYQVSLEYLLVGSENTLNWNELGTAEMENLPLPAQEELRSYLNYLKHKYSEQKK